MGENVENKREVLEFMKAVNECGDSDKVDREAWFYFTKFFDVTNKQNLKEKTRIIKLMAEGKTIKEIGDDFFKILDEYPGKGQKWD